MCAEFPLPLKREDFMSTVWYRGGYTRSTKVSKYWKFSWQLLKGWRNQRIKNSAGLQTGLQAVMDGRVMVWGLCHWVFSDRWEKGCLMRGHCTQYKVIQYLVRRMPLWIYRKDTILQVFWASTRSANTVHRALLVWSLWGAEMNGPINCDVI